MEIDDKFKNFLKPVLEIIEKHPEHIIDCHSTGIIMIGYHDSGIDRPLFDLRNIELYEDRMEHACRKFIEQCELVRKQIAIADYSKNVQKNSKTNSTITDTTKPNYFG